MSTNNTTIDWEEVKAYYLACRSYAATARQFGISPDSVRKRCARYGWEQANADKTGQEADKKRTNADTKTAVCPESEQAKADKTGQDAPPAEPRHIPFMQLAYISNLASQEVMYCAPWDMQPIAHDKLPDKEAYRAYIQNPGTQDCFISGVLGEVPSQRVSHENPAARMVAVIADFDTPLAPDKRDKMLAKLTTRPNFICRSYSGGTHAIWFLEKPFPLPCDTAAQNRLLATIRKKLKLNTAFGPLDDNAFLKLSQYYHVGWDWQQVNDEPIPEERTLVWLMDAVGKDSSTAEIPMGVVAAEVERRFPGRWQGDFAPGARGVRFWDAQADNPTAAIVTPTGMICFTGPFPWRSWEDIFGSDFLAQYRENTLGKVLKECFVVNNTFYAKITKRGRPCWQTFNRPNMESLLTRAYGLRTRAERSEDQSEVKEAIGAIVEMNSYSVARPFIYNPNTVVFYEGVDTLNTSLLRVHTPDTNKGKSWGDGFPWIADFLESLFPDCIQRERFICEWAYTYRHAHAGKPRNGRVTFIAGDVGVGKNFLTECLIGPSLGGCTDPSTYLLGQTRFNDSFFNVGVWVCNDTVTKGDERERQVFSSTLKRMAANMQHVWEGKFKSASSITWSGRVYITLNTDPVSLQILPDLDQSNRDKISLYRVSGPPLNDSQAAVKAREEMGALCAYLLNVEYPEHCRDGARWGVKNYLHPDLLAEAVNSGSTASFGEILSLFCKDMFEADPSLTCLEGAATWYLRKMFEQSSLKEMLRGCESPRSFGRRMAALSNTGSFPLTYTRKNTERVWRVDRAEFESYRKSGNIEGEIDDDFPF